MAAGGPAGALLDKLVTGMINASDLQAIVHDFRKVTLEAEVGIADLQHLVVRATVCVVAGRTAVPHGFMLEDIRSSLSRMAGSTGSALRLQDAFGKEILFVVPMRIMTIDTGHLAFRNRMMVWKRKLALDIQVTLDTGSRASLRIVDQVGSATLFRMQAPGPMTGFTPRVQPGLVTHQKSRVRCSQEISANSIVAEHTVFCSNDLRTFGLGHHQYSPVHGFTSDEADQDRA
jgi:hypothetical protein